MMGARERGRAQNPVLGAHGPEQAHGVDGGQEEDERHPSEAGHQDETQAASGIVGSHSGWRHGE